MRVILVYEVYDDTKDLYANIYKRNLIGVASNYPAATAIIVERREQRKENYPYENWVQKSAYEYINELGAKLSYTVEEREVREN